MLRQYKNDEAGNMAIMFAMGLFMLVTAMGVAVDLNSMDTERSKLQSLTDAATLAAAISGKQDQQSLQQIAEKVVAENNISGMDLTTTLTITPTNYIHVEITTEYQTMMMSLLGTDTIPLKTIAEAPPRSGGKMNIALVLDVTGSMEGSKIAALKTSALKLVTSIEGDASSGNVMMSVIPFSQYVKLPLAFDGASWLHRQPDQWVEWQELDLDQSTGCVTTGFGENATTTCTNPVYKTIREFVEWYGCMGSRRAPHNSVAEYNNVKLEGFVKGGWCHSEILPLTANIQDVKDTINGLGTGNDTYIPAGLIWGWRSLLPSKPLVQANTADYRSRAKAIVLMTDGENTRAYEENDDDDFDGEYHWLRGNEAKTQANALTAELCTKIKADNIAIYTIAFSVSDPTTKSLLQNCASDSDKFFDAGNADELTNAFDNIGRQLALVRLSK